MAGQGGAAGRELGLGHFAATRRMRNDGFHSGGNRPALIWHFAWCLTPKPSVVHKIMEKRLNILLTGVAHLRYFGANESEIEN